MTEQLASELNQKIYVSIMIDGVHCRYVKDGQPINRLVGHKAVAHAHAQGDFLSK